ncbi:hypothetical protein NECAME_10058 [Necator americanus]|uniref:MSP domain-containing protein n=1 Tax=Necator americanus TaxID=51031 RepID=W2TCY4_NECAM|nr:hypothetical protein NECAME_10058 [Necator americanus]ETN79056.1 hypothetical protein NECAME_10058 [Necator americanus]
MYPEFGGASKHVLTNAGSSRMVFKVKCSNNSLFKVSPVYAFLDPGASYGFTGQCEWSKIES